MRHYTKKESVRILSFFSSIPNYAYLIFLIFSSFISSLICSFSSFWSVLSIILKIIAWQVKEWLSQAPYQQNCVRRGRSLLSLSFSIKAICRIFSVKYKLIAPYFIIFCIIIFKKPIICRALGIKNFLNWRPSCNTVDPWTMQFEVCRPTYTWIF